MNNEGSLLSLFWFGAPLVIGFALTGAFLRDRFEDWPTVPTASFTKAWCLMLVVDLGLLSTCGTVLWREVSRPRSWQNPGGFNGGIEYALLGPIFMFVSGATVALGIAVLTTVPAEVTAFLRQPFKSSTTTTYFYIVLVLIVAMSLWVLYIAPELFFD